MTLCAHRFPDGTFCRRHAACESRFCYRHPSQSPLHLDDQHKDIHPLARLTEPEDVFNVVREALNAVRQGRITPGQAYAVGYLAELWLKIRSQLRAFQRDMALESQYLSEVLDYELREAKPPAPLPLPVAIDQQAAVEQVAATVKLNLKPPSDYPGWEEEHGRKEDPQSHSQTSAPEGGNGRAGG